MIIKTEINTVLFDLDGTLVDHFTTIYRCYCYALEQLGLPPVSYEKVRATVGGSVPVTLSRLIGPERAPQALEHFHRHFQEIMLEDLLALPGAAWLLNALNAQGLNLAVFTNKDGDAARAVCDHLGFTPCLRGVFGCGDTPYRKPQPEFSQTVMAKLGADSGKTLMVGDSPFDVSAGRACGIPVYCVTTGSHSQAELEAESDPPDGIFPDLCSLGETLFGIIPDLVVEPGNISSPSD